MLARPPLVVTMARNMHPIIPQLSSYCAAAVIFSMPRDDRAEGTTEWARVLDTGDVPPEGSETRRAMLTLSPSISRNRRVQNGAGSQFRSMLPIQESAP